MEADREGASPYGFSRAATDEILQIKKKFDEMAEHAAAGRESRSGRKTEP